MGVKELIFGGAAKAAGGGGTFQGSIQEWLPVKNIIGGVVITKDNRFIKILEVLPVNIYLKSADDRQTIIALHIVGGIGGQRPHFDLHAVRRYFQIGRIQRMKGYAENEENESCRAMIEDNIKEIGEGIASEAIRHRFFIIFEYEPQMKAKRNTVRGIVDRLNEEADTARRYLDICELEGLEPRYTDNFMLQLLYEIINKKASRRVKLPEGVFDMTTAIHGSYEQ